MKEYLNYVNTNVNIVPRKPIVKFDKITLKDPKDAKERKIVIKQTFDPTVVDKIFNDLLLDYIIEKNSLDTKVNIKKSNRNSDPTSYSENINSKFDAQPELDKLNAKIFFDIK